MASFHLVQSLQVVQSEYESGCKAILQLRIGGASEVRFLFKALIFCDFLHHLFKYFEIFF